MRLLQSLLQVVLPVSLRRGPAAHAAFDALSLELARSSGYRDPSAAPTEQRGYVMAFELGQGAGPATLAKSVESLLGFLPGDTELSIATVSGPATVPAHSASLPANGSLFALAASLRPSAEQRLREVRSYLFVRAPSAARARELFSDRERLHGFFNLVARPLSNAEVLSLLGPWCAEPVADGPVTACLTGEPVDFPLHPLQHLRFIAPVAVRTFECTHVQLRGSANHERPSRQSQTSTLIQGDARLVQQELPRYAMRLGEAGFRVSTAYPAKDVDKLNALPWLCSQKVALKRQHCGKLPPSRLGPAEHWLPLPLSAPLSLRLDRPSTALWVRDHLAVPLLFEVRETGVCSNMLILGAAGAGMTYLTNAMMAAHLCGGGHGWTLSWDGNPIFAAVHGTAAINLDAERPQSLNPLSGLCCEADFEYAFEYLFAWLCAVAGLSEDRCPVAEYRKHTHCLELALTLAWRAARENLGLGHVLERMAGLEGGAETVARIQQSLAGLPAAWFEGPSSLDSAAPFLSIATSGIQSAGHGALLAQTVVALHALASARGDRSTPKLLVIDEMEVLADNDDSNILNVVLRRAPKNNAQVVLTCRPFSAHRAQQTALQRVVDDGTLHKVLMSTASWPISDWFARAAGGLNVQVPRPGPRSSRKSSQFLWLTGAPSGARLLELELDSRLSTVMSALPWQARQFQEAREAGNNLDAALAASRAPNRPGGA